jgi:hypothetical protein
MKKRIIIVGIVFLLLIVGLSGCNEKSLPLDEEKFYGPWIYRFTFQGITVTVTYTFFSNKSIEIVGSILGGEQKLWGTWNITNNTIVMTSSENEIISGECSFSNNYNTLTIKPSSGDSLVLKKKYWL